MSDLSKKQKPSYAPVYCALYPQFAMVARWHGYALAVHGSVSRDFDVVCIPWEKDAKDPQEVVDYLVRDFDVMQIGEPEAKEHGRVAYTLSIGFGECAVDLSFMPRLP